MSLLPKYLQKWEEPLSGLNTNSVAVLSAWLPRLSAWLGPYPLLRPHHTGEPAGYGDLGRRGDYQHLVTSEWLLADEFPEEFLRRAAHKEHLFYKLTRLESKLQRSCFVFLDCGPGQLGKARLVQLALLIVLERTAAAARVFFNWAVLQKPGVLKNSLREEDLSYFLASRSLTFASPSLIKGCLGHIEKKGEKQDEGTEKEIWVIGDEKTKTMASKLGLLHISIQEVIPGLSFEEDEKDEDEDEEETKKEDSLLLHLGGPGQRNRSLYLHPPEEPKCVALLRRPFKEKTVNRREQVKYAGLPENAAIMLSSGCKVLFARAKGGDLLAYVIELQKTSPGESKPILISIKESDDLLAIEYRKGKIIQIYEGPEGMFIKSTYKNGRCTMNCMLRPPAPSFVSQAAVSLKPAYLFKHSNRIVFLDQMENAYLAAYGADQNISHYKPIAYSVQKYAFSPIGALFLGKRDDQGKRELLFYDMEKHHLNTVNMHTINSTISRDFEIPRDGVILRSDLNTQFYFTLPISDNRWIVVEANKWNTKMHWHQEKPIIKPDGHTVVGLVKNKRYDTFGCWYSLITLSNKGRTISLVGPGKSRAIVNEESPVTQLYQGRQQYIIAWKNALGRVKVYDIHKETILLIAHPEVNIETIG